MKKIVAEKRETALEMLKIAAKEGGVEAPTALAYVVALMEGIERELRAGLAPAEREKFMSACDAVMREASERQQRRFMRIIGSDFREDESKTSTCEKLKARLASAAVKTEDAQQKQQ